MFVVGEKRNVFRPGNRLRRGNVCGEGNDGERKADQTKENAENQTRPKRKEKKRSRPNKR